MKQKLMLVSVLALVLVLFSGCMINPSALMDKENDESSVTSIVNDAEDDQDEDAQDTEEGEDDDSIFGLYDSVEAYLETEEMQEMIESLRASVNGMNIEVSAQGNKLIYTYTYTDAVGPSTIGPILDEQMEKQASTFQTVAKQVKLVVNADEVLVQVVFQNPDGTVLSDTQFSSEE